MGWREERAMGNPVVHFEVGATDHQALATFYGAYGQVWPDGDRGIGGGIGAGGAALARAEVLGGSRVYGPIQAGEGTRTGTFRDPAGNLFGVYHRAVS
jgi:predicted enzyme related to lactoylglutathione lyase